ALRPAPVRTTPARKPTTRLRSPQDRVRRRRRRRPPTPPPPRRPLRGPSSPPRSASRCWSGTGRCCPAPGGPAVVRAPSRPSPTWAAARRRPPAPHRRRCRRCAGTPVTWAWTSRPWRGAAPGAGSSAATSTRASTAAARTPSATARSGAAAGEIELSEQVSLGVAVATERGLVVSTVPGAHALDGATLTERIAEQAGRAPEGTLAPAELTGSTLTVTNVGVFGVEGGVPILNPGQSTILALGAPRTQPWAHRGEMALRTVVTLT